MVMKAWCVVFGAGLVSLRMEFGRADEGTNGVKNKDMREVGDYQ
jgi:hypothetical protein